MDLNAKTVIVDAFLSRMAQIPRIVNIEKNYISMLSKDHELIS